MHVVYDQPMTFLSPPVLLKCPFVLWGPSYTRLCRLGSLSTLNPIWPSMTTPCNEVRLLVLLEATSVVGESQRLAYRNWLLEDLRVEHPCEHLHAVNQARTGATEQVGIAHIDASAADGWERFPVRQRAQQIELACYAFQTQAARHE